MESTKSSIPGYLNYAGSLSAGIGLFSFTLFILALREDVAETKLFLFIAWLVGTFISYAIGRDITDRIRNHEASADFIPTNQIRLARIGTKFIGAFTQFVGLVLLGMIVISMLERIEYVELICSGPNRHEIMRCAHDIFGLPIFH